MLRIYRPAPASARVTSPFGPRKAPKPGASTFHNGIDYGGKFKVTAARGGTVVAIGANLDPVRGYGYSVTIRHWEMTPKGIRRWNTLYAHGTEPTHLKVKEKVKKGQFIFISGQTGSATGDHLHFELQLKKGNVYVPVDPTPYFV